MIPKDAYEIIYKLCRMTPVIGDVGDKRDEALKMAAELMLPKKEDNPENKASVAK